MALLAALLTLGFIGLVVLATILLIKAMDDALYNNYDHKSHRAEIKKKFTRLVRDLDLETANSKLLEMMVDINDLVNDMDFHDKLFKRETAYKICNKIELALIGFTTEINCAEIRRNTQSNIAKIQKETENNIAKIRQISRPA